MEHGKLKTIGLAVIFLTFLGPFVSLGTVEYAEKTGKDCSQCHTDPSGGGGLTVEGKAYAKDLEKRGLYTPPTSERRIVRIIIGYLHIMTAFIWFFPIVYPDVFVKIFLS